MIPRSAPLHSSSLCPLINFAYSSLKFTGKDTVTAFIRLSVSIFLLDVGTGYVVD